MNEVIIYFIILILPLVTVVLPIIRKNIHREDRLLYLTYLLTISVMVALFLHYGAIGGLSTINDVLSLVIVPTLLIYAVIVSIPVFLLLKAAWR